MEQLRKATAAWWSVRCAADSGTPAAAVLIPQMPSAGPEGDAKAGAVAGVGVTEAGCPLAVLTITLCE